MGGAVYRIKDGGQCTSYQEGEIWLKEEREVSKKLSEEKQKVI